MSKNSIVAFCAPMARGDFVKIFMPLIASGIGVAAFFCFMFSWVELLLSRTLTATHAKPIAATMTRTVSASGLDWGVLAAAGVTPAEITCLEAHGTGTALGDPIEVAALQEVFGGAGRPPGRARRPPHPGPLGPR